MKIKSTKESQKIEAVKRAIKVKSLVKAGGVRACF